MRRANAVGGLFAVLAVVAGCASEDKASSVGESPTGTFLEPNDELGATGYSVLDEACDATEDLDYIERFVTPMFRDVAVQGEVAYLVDGSLLWAVSIATLSRPERLSLTRLPGHPVSVVAGPEDRLLVANGDNELLSVDISNPSQPTVAARLQDLPGISLDVAFEEGVAYVACGQGGLAAVDFSEPNEPVQIETVSLTGFANSVDVDHGLAFVAACGGFAIADVSEPASIDVIETVQVPDGNAKEIDADGADLLVASGDVLLLYDISEPADAEWIGFYADYQAEGFYVNDVVVRDGVAFIAAGDESFRAVDIYRMRSPLYYEADRESQSVDLEGAVQAEPPGTIEIWPSDPIGIGLFGDLLLVLGNFRWVGERLLMIVDVGETSSMSNVGEYAQPNDVMGLDDTKEGILLHGSDGRETMVTSAGEVLDEFQLNADVSKVDETEGEIFLLAENGYIYSRSSAGAVTPFIGDVYDFVVYGGYVYVSDYVVNTLGAYTTASRNPLSTAELENENALLGFSRLFNVNRHLYAYDWAMGDLHAFGTRDGGFDYLGRVDGLLCETYDIADFYSGLKTDRVKMQDTVDGFAMLCPHDEMGRASILYYDLSDPESPEMVERLELPSGRYADIIIDGNAVYTVGFDNNTYRSTLSRFEGDSSISHAFDGHANGVLLVDGEVWVADGDVGIRRFSETGDGFEFVDILAIEK